MKRKPLNKSRLNYLKQNTPLNVVPEKKLKKADSAGLIENRGKSRFRTKKLRERVETLIRSDLMFKSKTNAKPHPEQLVRTTSNLLVLPQARNTLKARNPFHLNMNAKRSVHLLNCFANRSAHPYAYFETFATFAEGAARKATSGFKEIGTKYIVKRTVLGSTKNFSNTRFKVHSQDLKQLIEGRGRKVSPYKARLLERKKLSLIYGNLGWREVRKCVLQSKHKKGVASPKSGNKKTRPQTSSLPENLITLLESRLDVVLYRCRFFPSFSSCKQAINHGKILVNHRQVRIAGHLLKAGDLIQVNPQSKQEHVVSKKANCLLAFENEKQKTLLYFQNKIKSRPLSPSLPSALLTRFDPLHRFPWNTKQKPNHPLHNNTSNQLVALRAKQFAQAIPALRAAPSAKVAKDAKVAKGLNLENQANSLFRDLKERKRILRTLSSRSNERLDGNGYPYGQHVTRDPSHSTDRLIKPLRNRDNPSLFLRPQSKSGVTSTKCLAFTNNQQIAGTASQAIRKAIKQSTGLKKLFPPFYRAVKPLNLEVSYKTLTAIFLFPPQKVYFPAHIDLEMIGKSI